MTPESITNQVYASISSDNKPRELKAWHASTIAQCPKAQYLMRLGVPATSKPTAAKMLRWQVGHEIETALRPHIAKLYPSVKSNQELYSKAYDLAGEYDNYDLKSRTLIEIKSVGPRAIRNRRKDETRYNLRDDKPYLAHEWQQHAYVLLLDNQVDNIVYIYVSLEGLLAPYMTQVRPDVLDGVRVRLTTLNEAWRLQTPPGCICEPSNPLWGSVLQFCDYRSENGCCLPNPLPNPLNNQPEIRDLGQ